MEGKRVVLICCGAVAAAVAVAVIAASGSDPTEPKASGSQSACEPPIRFETAGKTVLNRVRFPGYGTKDLRVGEMLQVDPRGKTDFSKLGLEVRGSAPVVLVVPRRSRRSVDLAGWGANTSGFRADRITIDLGSDGACHGIWPGGFYFNQNQCLNLEVRTKHRTARMPFGLGRDC